MSDRIPRQYVIGLLTAAMLAVVLIPSRGQYRADSMILVFVAMALVLWHARDLASPTTASVAARLAAPGIVVGLASFLVTRMVDQRLIANPATSEMPLRILSAVELPLVLSYLFDGKLSPTSRWPASRFALLAAASLAFGLTVVHVVPSPTIDVWTVQMEGARALLHGQNPFEVVAMHDTAPGVMRDDVPYVYPPFHLLLTLPAYALGDVRYAMIVALVVSGIALRTIALRSAGQRLPIIVEAPALLLWLAPKVPYILEQAWIDPMQVALIAVACALAVRARYGWAAVMFGCVLAAKQTMFWVAPLAMISFAGFRLRHALVGGAIGVAPYVAFAAWNPRAFWHANVAFVSGLPARPDALSLVNWAKRVLGVAVPYGIAFPLAALVVALVFVRRRRAPEAFGFALLVTYFAFFLFNKWTFANYYFTLMGFAALGAALSTLVVVGASTRSGQAEKDRTELRDVGAAG